MTGRLPVDDERRGFEADPGVLHSYAARLAAPAAGSGLR